MKSVIAELPEGVKDDVVVDLGHRKELGGTERPSFRQTLVAVIARDFRVQVLTDPVLYGARAVLYWVVGFMLCTLWIEGREYDNEYLMSRMWPVAMTSSSDVLMSLVCVYFFHSSWSVVGCEIRNGFYSPSAYFISTFLLSIPCVFVLSLAMCWGNLYGLGNYQVFN